MQRFLGVLMLLLAGLSLLVSTQAFRTAHPANQSTVTVVNTNQGALALSAGPNNSTLYNMVTISSGRLLLDMRKGPTGSNFGLDKSSTYTLNKIITVTNPSGPSRSVSVTVSGNTLGTLSVSGHINGGAKSNPPFALAAGQAVDLNLTWATGPAAGANTSMTITVSGN